MLTRNRSNNVQASPSYNLEFKFEIFRQNIVSQNENLPRHNFSSKFLIKPECVKKPHSIYSKISRQSAWCQRKKEGNMT